MEFKVLEENTAEFASLTEKVIETFGASSISIYRDYIYAKHFNLPRVFAYCSDENSLISFCYSTKDAYGQKAAILYKDSLIFENPFIKNTLLTSGIVVLSQHGNADRPLMPDLTLIESGYFYKSITDNVIISDLDGIDYELNTYSPQQIADLTQLVHADEVPYDDVIAYRQWLNSDTIRLILTIDAKPAGIVCALLLPNPMVNYFWVEHTYRNRGIGSFLLQNLAVVLQNKVPVFAMSPSKNQGAFVSAQYEESGVWWLLSHEL